MNDINQMNLALDRTVLANERTYAAWIRTGLAALAAGLGIAKFMTGLMPLWSILIIAAVLIGFSSVAFLLAGCSAARHDQELESVTGVLFHDCSRWIVVHDGLARILHLLRQRIAR